MQLTLNIPAIYEQKAKALISYLKSLDFVTVETTDDFDVPQWQKDIVNERMKTATKDSFKPWKEAKKQLAHK